MKINRSLMTIAVLLGLGCAGNAQAAAPVTRAAGNLIYLGIKGGIMSNDAQYADNAFNIGVYGGYNLLGEQARYPKNLGGGTLSVEGEFTATAVKGDAGPWGKWNIMTLAGYAAYRFPLQNNFYLKGKAGLRWQDIDTGTPVRWNGSETGGTIGFGAGLKLPQGNLEAEISLLGSDITFVSLGYLF